MLRRVHTKENIRRRIVRSNERMIGKKMFVSVAIRRFGAHQRRRASVASINAAITQRENVQWGSANTSMDLSRTCHCRVNTTLHTPGATHRHQKKEKIEITGEGGVPLCACADITHAKYVSVDPLHHWGTRLNITLEMRQMQLTTCSLLALAICNLILRGMYAQKMRYSRARFVSMAKRLAPSGSARIPLQRNPLGLVIFS